jgi:hypothetical protein
MFGALLLQVPEHSAAQSGGSGNDDSLVSIEAESFSAGYGADGHDWSAVSISGATGNRALQAMPNTNSNRDVNFVANSPRLDYVVNFAEAGTYHVWIRGRAASNKDDSLHVGLNGVAQARADRLYGFDDRWGWSDETMDGNRATLRVASAGQQTINIWMREDGMIIDKIVLSKDSAMRPDDFGAAGPPATTSRPPTSGSPSDGGADSNGIVSIEVEQYTSNVGVGGHDWVPALASGASGGGSMQPLPNNNTNRDTGFVVNSPRLDFDVNFPQSGRYYVWVRGRGSSSSDDSLHIGLNGQAQARANRISGFRSGWSWSDETMDGARASIDVDSAGAQQLTVWMREDGTIVDKVVLTQNPSLHPTDFGPLGPPATDPGSTTPVTPQPQPSSRFVALEAEHFVSNVGVGAHGWSAVSPSGSSGRASLQALPNVGENIDTGFVADSPRLDYAVNFPAAGTYYVWIRGRGLTGSDDSLHVGLNGRGSGTADRISGFADTWGWTNETMDKQRATIVVANAGNQVLNIWMREDGLIVDKIVLAQDSSLHPRDFGTLGPPSTDSGPMEPAPANRAPSISGTPPTTVEVGQLFVFTPSANDADGDNLSYAITGKPGWASFNDATGELRGRPGTARTWSGIRISVSDGRETASLPAFSITATAGSTPVPVGSRPPGYDLWLTNAETYGNYWGQQLDPRSGNGWNLRLTWQYYDAQWVFLQIGDHLGQVEPWRTYGEHARFVYYDEYIVPDNFRIQGYRRFPHGLYEDYLRGGDTTYDDLIKLRDRPAFSAAAEFIGEYNGQCQHMSREMAYALQANIIAERAGAARVSEGGTTRVKQFVTWMEAHFFQWMNGGYGQYASACRNASQPYSFLPFMAGLSLHALSQLEEWETSNGRSVDALWNGEHWPDMESMVDDFLEWLYFDAKVQQGGTTGQPMWVDASATESAIRYEDRNDTSPAWDLNNLIAPAYAWAALRHARAETAASDDKARFFIDAGDRLFNGGVRRAYIDGNGKQFNQNYRWTFKFIEWREAAMNRLN